jgi:hypothetical protein
MMLYFASNAFLIIAGLFLGLILLMIVHPRLRAPGALDWAVLALFMSMALVLRYMQYLDRLMGQSI